jgi:hypothetical protein
MTDLTIAELDAIIAGCEGATEVVLIDHSGGRKSLRAIDPDTIRKMAEMAKNNHPSAYRDATIRACDEMLSQQKHEIRQLREVNAALVEALRPFAHFGKFCNPDSEDYDDNRTFSSIHITCGMMRNALAALVKAGVKP